MSHPVGSWVRSRTTVIVNNRPVLGPIGQVIEAVGATRMVRFAGSERLVPEYEGSLVTETDVPTELRAEMQRLADAAEARSALTASEARRTAFLEALAIMDAIGPELGIAAVLLATEQSTEAAKKSARRRVASP